MSSQVRRPAGDHCWLLKTKNPTALAAVNIIDPDRWWNQFGVLVDRIRPRFARFEPARHASALMLGLLAGLERKNCWTIAEHRGGSTPDGLRVDTWGGPGDAATD